MIKGQEKDRETFLADVLTDAVVNEGIDYWSEVTAYAFVNKDEPPEGALLTLSPHGGSNARAIIVERDVSTRHELTPMAVAKGFKRLEKWRQGVLPAVEGLNVVARDHLLSAYMANDASGLVPDDIDVIVQLGLFDELRYN